MTLTWRDNMPLYSSDGAWVAFVSFHAGRWSISVGPVGEAAKRVTSSEHGDGGPAWSPDGSKLVYYSLTKDSFDLGMDWEDPAWRESEGLYVLNRDGSERRRVTDGDDVSPCWSADGESIAFERWTEPGAPCVWAVGVEGDHPRLLVRGATNPACSPKGSRIAFDDAEGSIIVLDRENGSSHVVAIREGASAPAWSPDGSRIAFSAGDVSRLESLEIYVVNADGSRLRRLTRDAHADASPVWTPDGRIMFKSFRPKAQGVYVMNGDGTMAHLFRAPSS